MRSEGLTALIRPRCHRCRSDRGFSHRLSRRPVSFGDQNLAVMLTGAQCPVVSVAMLPLES
jgi:hypothetical protein